MGKLPYLTSKTEEKQRGYVIASEFGGPLDVTSWVAYIDNLKSLPNLYEGKMTYVYEDNQIYVYVHNDKTGFNEWQKLTNNVNVISTSETTRFMLLFYEGNSEIATDILVDNELHNDVEIQARLYVEVGANTGRFMRYNNTQEDVTDVNDPRYNKDLKYYWYKNNRGNRLQKVLATKEYKVNTVGDNIYRLDDNVYENGYIICIITQTKNGVEKIIACNRIRYRNNHMDAADENYGLYYLTNKTSMLQRGYLMASEQGGGIDATTSVNSTADLDGFTNNYLGKLVYSYKDDEYMYYASNEGARYTNTNLTKVEKVKYIKEHTTGTWTPIGTMYVDNNLTYRWEITGRNYTKNHNGICIDSNGHVMDVINQEDWRPDQLQERYNNGQVAQYEAHLYITINGVEHEVDAATLWNNMTVIDDTTNATGKVFYRWTVEKPTGGEYYDPSDYDHGVHVQDEDENRTVWIRDIDYTVVGGSYVNNMHKNGTIKAADGSTLDFKNSYYSTNIENVNGDEEGHTLSGVVSDKNTYTSTSYSNNLSNYMEIIYTNDYDDAEVVKLTCTAYFKDHEGKIRYIDSPTYVVNIAKEHLVYVLDENEGDSKIKGIDPDKGQFIIDGGLSATIADFTLSNNEYKIGYGIMYYTNEALANEGYYPTDHTKGDASKGTLVYELYYNTSNQKVVIDSIMNLAEPVSIANKPGRFEFTFTTKDRYASKMPFGWYKVFVFRRTYEDDLLYASIPIHYYQTITNATNYVYPDNAWMGYYQLDKEHEYQATIEVKGTNLLYKDIPVIENGDIVKKYNSSVFKTTPLNVWTTCTNNSTYTRLNAIQPFVDPRTSTYPSALSKNRHVEFSYYSENDIIETIIDSIDVNNVMIPDLDPVVDSIYKWPNGTDIFIYNTNGYTISNPIPYTVPVNDFPTHGSPATGVVTNFKWTLHGVATSTGPLLQFGDTFEVKANVNNQANVITDSYTSITGRTFSPTVYDLKITIEQPSIHNDSDYYEDSKAYQLISHIWYRTSETSEWTEFTQEQLGTVTYTWKEKDNQDIFFSNVEEISSNKSVTGTNTNGGYNNIWFGFYNKKFMFCYVKVTAKVFGYEISCTDEIKVRNPIDSLEVSHKIYSGNREFKAYGAIDTRQLESEWIEMTITPTLVEWFDWSDIKTTLVFKIDGEVVDETSTKYKIEYNGTRNHFYEGTFRVYWKKQSDLPDETLTHTIFLNKCTEDHVIPVVLVTVRSINIYPLNHDRLNVGYPDIDKVFINAKNGTSQRYILVVEGVGLDDDPMFLSLTKEGFKETLSGAASIGSTAARTSVTVASSGFQRVTDTASKLVYYINDNVNENTLYTVKYTDANQTYTRTAKTYAYNDDSIKSFSTMSAYTNKTSGGYSFLDKKWIDVYSVFSPSYTYETVAVKKTVVDNTTYFTSTAEYDLHTIGIVSGNNVLSKTTTDTKHVYTASISRSYDLFTAVLKDFSTDVSSTLPTTTDVYYRWSHDGTCLVDDPYNPYSASNPNNPNTSSMTTNKLYLFNKSDSDVTENVNLKVMILHHPATFTNWQGSTLTISDYILNADAKNQTMGKLQYKIDITKESLNLTIGQTYSMSELFKSITTTMYRYDLDHSIKITSWTKSQMNNINNNNIVFTAVNTGTSQKPSSINSNRQLIVSTDKGADVKVDWRTTDTTTNYNTKASSTLSFTSDIIKESITINPSSNTWDLKVIPVINTTITLKGQNLAYGYTKEGNNFLYVIETGQSTHKASFNPGITNNAYGTYTYSSSYTDTNHCFGYSTVGACGRSTGKIDNEQRSYVYYFGSNTKTYTATYQNKKITNITFSPSCLISNHTYGSNIAVPFSISSENMFGPADIKNNEHDLTWAWTPSTSTLEGTFTNSAGSTGSGTLTLATKKLTDDQSISITVTREDNVGTYSSSIPVSKISSITSASVSKNSAGNPVLSVTFTGQHMDCNNTNYYVAISKDSGANYTTLGSAFKPNSASSYTVTAALPDKTTFHAGLKRTVKVWMDAGNVAGQYATKDIAASNPSALTIAVVSGSISTDTINCNQTSSTLYWKINVDGTYADGTTTRLDSNVQRSKSITGLATHCRVTTATDNPVSTKDQLPAGSYNCPSASNQVDVNGIVTQRKDSITSVSYGPSSCSPSSFGVGGGTVTISATRTATWQYGGNEVITVSETHSSGTNYHNSSSKSVTITPSWDSTKTCSVTLSADTCSINSSKTSTSYTTFVSSNPSTLSANGGTASMTVSGTTTYKWEWASDGASCGTTYDYPSYTCNNLSYSNNHNNSNASSKTLTCQGVSRSIAQNADSCQSSGGGYGSFSSNGTVSGCGSHTKDISATYTTYYSYYYGGESCGSNSSSVSDTCSGTTSYNGDTFSCTKWGHTFTFTQSGTTNCYDSVKIEGTLTWSSIEKGSVSASLEYYYTNTSGNSASGSLSFSGTISSGSDYNSTTITTKKGTSVSVLWGSASATQVHSDGTSKTLTASSDGTYTEVVGDITFTLSRSSSCSGKTCSMSLTGGASTPGGSGEGGETTSNDCSKCLTFSRLGSGNRYRINYSDECSGPVKFWYVKSNTDHYATAGYASGTMLIDSYSPLACEEY